MDQVACGDYVVANLNDTRIQREQSGARLIHTIMSGVGPLIRILIRLSPFAVECIVLTIQEATLVAVGLGIGVSGMFWRVHGLDFGAAIVRCRLSDGTRRTSR